MSTTTPPKSFEVRSAPIESAPARRVRKFRPAPFFGGVFLVVLFGYLYLPPIVMSVFSFSANEVQSLPLTGFSTRWYEELFASKRMLGAVQYSLVVSGTAIAASLVLGTLFAIILWKAFKGRALLQTALALPLLLPGMVLGVSLVLTFRIMGLQPGFLTLVITHTVFLVPIVVFIVGQRLTTLDPSLVQASKDLGANSFKTFIRIVLPSIASALLAAALVSFTMSFDELAASYFVSGFDTTLPVYVFSLLRAGFSPMVNAVFTILAVISVVVVLIAFAVMFSGRGRRKK